MHAVPNARRLLAVTMGDPGGIGPEVIVRALADDAVRECSAWCVLGPEAALLGAAAEAGVDPFWDGAESQAAMAACLERGSDVVVLDDGSAGAAGAAGERRPTAAGGELSFRLVEQAIAMAIGAPGCVRAAGVVTGPISKEAWELAGHGEFPGHTELFAARCGVKRYGMMFVSPRLRVILATAHVPLSAVSGALSVARVLETIELGHGACIDLGVERPRIAVCGLNPHAGEGGLLGSEDADVIAPAIEGARESGIDARGPFPGDTVFLAAVQGAYDLVVAMYHDQGLIPVKLLDRDRAVNVTVGLPIIRTSPDHGTAFDIAGCSRADAGSMKAAMVLAGKMAG